MKKSKSSIFANRLIANGALLILAILLFADGYAIVIDTLNQNSGRYVMPKEVAIWLAIFWIAGGVFGAIVFFQMEDSSIDSHQVWLKNLRGNENRRKIEGAATLMVAVMFLSYFVRGESSASIMVLKNPATGVVINILLSFLGAMFFAGFFYTSSTNKDSS